MTFWFHAVPSLIPFHRPGDRSLEKNQLGTELVQCRLHELSLLKLFSSSLVSS